MFLIKHKAFSLGILIFLASIIVLCTKINDSTWTNPLLPDYKGEYRLSVSWNILPDTLVTGVEYRLPCALAVNLKDTFALVQAYLIPSGALDTSLFISRLKKDSLSIRFSEEYTGTLYIKGIRPNSDSLVVSKALIVKNYKAICLKAPIVVFRADSVIGALGDSTTLLAFDSLSNGKTFYWIVDLYSKPFITTSPWLKVLFNDSMQHSVWVKGIDFCGQTGPMDSINVRFKNLQYKISKATMFPETIRAKVEATWAVSIDSAAKFFSRGGKFNWQVTVNGIKKDTTTLNDTLRWLVNDSSSFSMSVFGSDSLGGSSAQIHQPIIVRTYKPYFKFSKSIDTARMGESITLSAKAHDTDPNGSGSIDSIFWYMLPGGSLLATSKDSSITSLWNVPGTYKIFAKARDGMGFYSTNDTMTIVVLGGVPYFSPFASDTTVFINTSLLLKVFEHPGTPLVPVTKYYWTIKGAINSFDTTNSDTLRKMFSVAGKCTVSVLCKDADSITSSVLDTFIVTVNFGEPFVTSVTPDTVWIKDTTSYAVHARDVNATGRITQYKVLFEGAVWDSSADSVIKHVFQTSGTKKIRVVVKDNDGNYSDTLLDSVIVNLGKPVILSITSDSDVFINDTRQFTIVAYDTNGIVDSVKIDNGSGTFEPYIKITNSTYTFSRIFHRNESGSRIIRVIGKDDDGVISETGTLTVVIQLGAPSIDSVKIDTALTSLFVKDLRSYRIYANDSKGSIKMMYAAWNGGDIPDDSVAVNFTGSGSGVLTHSYDTSLWGNRNVKFWVRDNDALMSSSKDSTIAVRLGAPVVWGDKKGTPDTCFMIINNGPGYYKMHSNAIDSNGIIQKYFWDDKQGWKDSSVTDSSNGYQVRAIDINHIFSVQFAFGARDDDMLFRQVNIVVVADSTPRAITATSDPIAGGRKLSWSGLDAVDSLATQYRILVKKGSQLLTSDTTAAFIAKDWTAGGDAAFSFNAIDVFPFKWAYLPTQGTGAYYFQIQARDKRGSVSVLPLSGTNVFSY